MTTKLNRIIVVLLLCIGVSLLAVAQSTTQGSISGTVFDQTNAVVPGAVVTVHNNGTNAEIKLTADASGFFKAPLVEPGNYTVSVKAQGFGGYKATNVTVFVGQPTNIKPVLTLGATTETVTVTAEAPVLNFESPDFTASLPQVALQNIPMNNKRWSSLAMTTPGVVSNSSGFGLVSVRGISELLNGVEIDGADDNDAYWSEERGRTREAYSTSENAVREFTVNTGVYSAEFGRAAGGVIASVTKSGTNTIHGQVYFYDRESKWAAFNDQTTENINTGTTSAPNFVSTHIKPKDLRKIYGFTAGGALIKDKLFWEYTYDQHSRIFPELGAPSTPSTFYAPLDPQVGGPAVGTLGTFTIGSTTYTCSTAGTISPAIPSSALESGGDTGACQLAARYNLGSYAAGYAAYNTGLNLLNNALGISPRAGYQEINTPKVDWQINPKEHLSVLFHRLRWDSPGGVQTAPVVAYSMDAEGNDFVRVDYGVAKLTSTITNSITNEVLYQYGREVLPETQQPYTSLSKNYFVGNSTNSTGQNLVGGNNVTYVSSFGTGTFAAGSPYYSYRTALPDERKWQVADTLYYNRGNHSFKFGGDILHNWDNLNNLYENNGAYSYSSIGNFLSDLANESPAALGISGAIPASHLCGSTGSGVGTYQCYSSFVQGFGTPSFAVTTTDWSAFIQDNWKFSPRLTIELGIRYDFELLPQEQAALVNPAIPGTANRPEDKNNFGPRVGFAYDVFGTGKTVLRGGYGMYYGRVLNGVVLNLQLNSGLATGQYTTTFSPTSGSAAPSPVFPNIVTSGTITTPGAYYLDNHLQNPMVHQFDVILQQDLGKGNFFTLSYLGSLGRELPNYINTNLNPATTLNQNVTFSGGPLAGQTTSTTLFTSFANTSYQGITDLVSNINSSYNAMSAELQNRTLKLMEFDLNYTWSHALDFAQNASTGTSTEGWLNPYAAARTNYGNANNNVPNRLAGYVLFHVPNYFANKKSIGAYLANGWSINDSFQFQNGLPYSAGLQGNRFFNGSPSVSSALTGWYGAGVTSYFPLVGRNTYTYARAIVDDLRLQKQIDLTDRYNLVLLANVFNLSNHQNWSSVNSTMYNVATSATGTTTLTYVPTFGTVSTTNNSGFLYTPRQIEIGAKFNF